MKKIALIYAYIVCLSTIVSTFVATAYLVMYGFDYANPEQAIMVESYEAVGPQDFETYYLGHIESAKRGGKEPMKEADLRKVYDFKLREEDESTRFDALRSIVAYGIVFVGSLVLFFTHFTWARRMVKAEDSSNSRTP